MAYETETQIELVVERKMNKLDALFMHGGLSQADYDRKVDELNNWAEEQYRLIPRRPF